VKLVVQRVSRASVKVEAPPSEASIGVGLLALCGAARGDTDADAEWCARKLVGLRIFEDEAGRMNRGLDEVEGGLLLIPNFTLAGDCRRGRRPSFDGAMPPAEAAPFFDAFVERVRALAAEMAGREPYPISTELLRWTPAGWERFSSR